jgi:hypothetical protein
LVLSAFAKPNIGDRHAHRWASQKRSAPTDNECGFNEAFSAHFS